MDFWKSVEGMLRVELIDADPASALMHLAAAGITVYDVVAADDRIVTNFSVSREDRMALEAIAEKRDYQLRFLGVSGIYWRLRAFLRRPVMAIGLLLFCFLALFLPSRVLFVRVEGNATVPTRLILEESRECGIIFGAQRRQVRSERVKNALLEAIPELQWVGINTHGCVAVITVRERTEAAQLPQPQVEINHIVALRDGVITRCVVTKGQSLCSVGQAVRAGQVLISGYRDCGICIQAGPAEGEIYAQTERLLRTVMPLERQKTTETKAAVKKYSLIIGKKRINFYKGSGISGATCDKMYEEYYVTLPGGFVLPICIITETWSEIALEQTELEQDKALATTAEFSRQYLLKQMNAGAILHKQESSICLNGLVILEGEYACEEMIGQVKSEEIGLPNG